MNELRKKIINIRATVLLKSRLKKQKDMLDYIMPMFTREDFIYFLNKRPDFIFHLIQNTFNLDLNDKEFVLNTDVILGTSSLGLDKFLCNIFQFKKFNNIDFLIDNNQTYLSFISYETITYLQDYLIENNYKDYEALEKENNRKFIVNLNENNFKDMTYTLQKTVQRIHKFYKFEDNNFLNFRDSLYKHKIQKF